MSRNFARTSIVSDGHPRSGYRIVCAVCGTDEKIIAANSSNSLPAEVIAKKFQQKGWTVGNIEQADKCPKCIVARLEARAGASAIVKASAAAEAIKVTPDPPREMQREDKRLIFGKIDEVYLDERRGYEVGWSDQTIASDLGIPLDWVRRVREENFGPEGLNEDARKSIAEIRAMSIALDALQAVNTQQQREILDLREKVIRMDRAATELEKIYGRRK